MVENFLINNIVFRFFPFDCLVAVAHFFDRNGIVKVAPESNKIRAALAFNPVIKYVNSTTRVIEDMHIRYLRTENGWMVSIEEPEHWWSKRAFEKSLPLGKPPLESQHWQELAKPHINGFGRITICIGLEGVEV